MQAVVMSLQHQLTIVHHQSSPPIVPQNGTDLSDLMDCISALRNEVWQLKEDNQERKSLMQSSSQLPRLVDITLPLQSSQSARTSFQQGRRSFPLMHRSMQHPRMFRQSACAGYVPPYFMNMSPKKPRPPGQPGTPSSSTSSRSSDPGRGKGGNTPPSTHDPSPSWPSNPGDGSGVGGSPIARRQDGLRSVGRCRF